MERIVSVRDMENAVLSHEWACIVFTRAGTAQCKEALPRVRRMLKRFSDVPGFSFDLDDDPAAAGRYLVFDTPSVIVYHKGKPIIRQIGSVSVPQIYDSILQVHQAQDLT